MSDINHRAIDRCEACFKQKAAYLAFRQSFMGSTIKLLCYGCLQKKLDEQKAEKEAKRTLQQARFNR